MRPNSGQSTSPVDSSDACLTPEDPFLVSSSSLLDLPQAASATAARARTNATTSRFVATLRLGMPRCISTRDENGGGAVGGAARRAGRHPPPWGRRPLGPAIP